MPTPIPSTQHPPRTGWRRLRLSSMAVQVVMAIVVGLLLGLLAPALSENLKFIGDLFIRLIKMVIVPLVFPLITVAIAQMESARSLGRLAAKSLLYFEVVTTLILAITIGLGVLSGIGSGAQLAGATAADTSGVGKSLDIGQIFLDIVPVNVFAAFAEGHLLPIIFFATLLGAALSHLGPRAKPMMSVLEGLSDAMFVLIGWIVKLTPLAVVTFVAYNTAHYGWSLIVKLATFVAVFYVACLVVLAVLFPVIAAVFKVPYVSMMRFTGDLVVLAFVTRSAEVVLAPLINRLDRFGVPRRISSFTLPLGYSFNSDGATMYEGLAVVFLAHAYGIPLDPAKIVTIMLVLMLLTKGVAGVPSASIVILFSAATVIGLPAEGVAILLAVDFVVDMARTAVNVTGNSLASMVVAKSESVFDPEGAAEAREAEVLLPTAR